MAMDASPCNWIYDAFFALNDVHLPTSFEQKWPSGLPQESVTLSHFLTPRQITPPEDLSLADDHDDSIIREDFVPAELLQNEMPWSVKHQVQASPAFQPPQLSSLEKSQSQGSQPHASNLPGASKQVSAGKSQANPPTSEQQASGPDPQQPKRKRGRPKLQPQTIEACNADRSPFNVSSARQMHLRKNRVAAHKCRQRQKDYTNGLEDRARDSSAKNKFFKEEVAMLRGEVLMLKNEVLCHTRCGFWAINEYVAQCVGDLLWTDGPIQESSEIQISTLSTPDNFKEDRETSAETLLSQRTTDSHELLMVMEGLEFEKEIGGHDEYP